MESSDVIGLIAAVRYNDLDEVKKVLDLGVDVDATSPNGSTALMEASQRGYIDLVRYLAEERGADLTPVSRHTQKTCLFLAAQFDRVQVAKFLCRKNPSLMETPDFRGVTPLMAACGNGHVETADFLIANGANVEHEAGTNNLTPLLVACKEGHLEVVRMLIEEARVNSWAKTRAGKTGLALAVRFGRTPLVRFLSRICPHLLDEPDNLGFTPLIFAVAMGFQCFHEVGELLEAGANPNVKDYQFGKTPLLIATLCGHLRMVKMLVEKGAANVLEKDFAGQTALFAAVSCNNVEMMEYLLDKGGYDLEEQRNLPVPNRVPPTG